MNIYVLDKQLNIVNVIDTYTSIIWTNRYYECGDFELYLPASSNLISILREDYFLVREGHEDNAMIIETIQINTDEENGNYLTVSGRCLKSIFHRRIIWNQTQVSGFIENCISQLINENVISPVDTSRQISNVGIGDLISTNTNLTAQYTGDYLDETITSICQSYGLGWDISLDLETKKFTFKLYSGVDRSYNQETVAWVVFSNEYDNLLSTEYVFSKSNYANVTKVAGEGEGLARKNITVGDATGLERYEVFTDARDLSTNEGEISDEQYYSQLTEKGNETLAETTKSSSFSGEVIEYQYTYGKDYLLGDIVEIVNEYGMSAVSRITEVIESEDESGIYTIPTFSAWEGFAIAEPEEDRNSMLFVPQPTPFDDGDEGKKEEDKGLIDADFNGIEFNVAVKTAYNGRSTTYETVVSGIETISFTDEPPNDEDYSIQLAYNSDTGYEFLVYAPSDDKSNIKMYTNAGTVRLSLDMRFMFYCLTGVISIDLSKFDTSKVTDMCYMFGSCCELTSLNLSKFDTSNVKNMSFMFIDCTQLTTLDLSNFNTSNVVGMLQMFRNCYELTSLNLSSFTGTKVQTLNQMFFQCEKLATLDLSNFNTTSDILTDMANMFSRCYKLTHLNLSKINTNNSTNMDYMFSDCSSLAEILVGNGWVKGTNTANMFSLCKCYTLTYV